MITGIKNFFPEKIAKKVEAKISVKYEGLAINSAYDNWVPEMPILQIIKEIVVLSDDYNLGYHVNRV
ncbi:MAG TPA: hypothetical protein PKD37_05010 [Oligoflexia bacterium]|nr:hypothetical protein [Oligoflexia bacterium]HMP27326.1 hypothetical protein [Oligoflexia bacterium]